MLFAGDILPGITRDIPDQIESDVEVRTVTFSLLELEQARKRASELLERSGLPFHTGIDIQHNTVNLYIPGPLTADYEQVLASDPSLTDKVKVVGGFEVISPPLPSLNGDGP